MTEFIIVIPVFILIIFGTIQVALVYSAKTTLNYATFQAARLGAVNHASYSSMRRGLMRGLAPLYTNSTDLDGVANDIRDAYDADSDLRNSAAEVDNYVRIIRLSPTADAFTVGGSGAGEINSEGIVEIPNDNLMYRDSSASVDGVSIQDANLLKIRVQYCFRLMVPIVNKIIGSLSELNNQRNAADYHEYDTVNDPRFADRNKGFVDEAASSNAALSDYDSLCGGNGGEDRAANLTGIVLSSDAIVRMQSAAWEEDPDEDFEAVMCNGQQMVCP